MSSPTLLDIPRGPLLAPVLGRVVRFHCARATLDIDRMSDAVLVCDAMAARVWDHARDGRVRISVADVDGRVVLDVGPLAAGGAQGLLDSGAHGDLGSIFTTLCDAVWIDVDGEGDRVHLELGQRPVAGD